jgi:mannosylglycoprotein endo-beta-mannosidase
MAGKDSLLTQVFVGMGPTQAKKFLSIKESIDLLRKDFGIFLSLQLLNADKEIVSDNFYWLPEAKGVYSGVNQLAPGNIQVEATQLEKGKVEVKLSNFTDAPVAFFNRISLIDPSSRKRILPVFYSDNYVSLLPGTQKTVILEYSSPNEKALPLVSVKGWNAEEKIVEIKE